VKFAIALLLMLGIAGCGYRGDGEFFTDGTWPFADYRLELPEFELAPGTHRFRIEGFKSHREARVQLYLRGEAERLFRNISVPVRVRLEEEDGGVLFWKEGPPERAPTANVPRWGGQLAL
jgi:hypothetical protein